VVVLEKTDQVGGRNREVTVGDAKFDGGPTLMMMLDPFRKLFTDVGEKLEDHLDIRLCDPSYRVFYRDGSRIEGTTNVAKMIDQINRLSGRKDALAYPKLLGDLADLYREAIPRFVERNYNHIGQFIGGKALPLVLRHRMLGNLAKGIGRYVEDPRLRMLFSFQTMYLGLSPYDAPWVYAVLTYMEYGEGIWYPMGGMVEIARSIERLATKKGAEFRLNTAVKKVEGRNVILESGEVIEAEAVICNADLPYAERELQSLPAKPKRRYSCSALMLYAEVDGEIDGLEHHNVFFGADFEGNLRQIFDEKRIPTDPAFYAAVSCKTDPERCKNGRSNLYLLIPAPNLDHHWTEAEENALIDGALKRLQDEAGFDPARILQRKTYRPQDWADDLNLDRGAAFGLSHDFWQSAYFRPSNRSKSNRNMVFVGASTQPGNGLPMVLISADLAERRLVDEGRLR
jgi:phytoene desaturase